MIDPASLKLAERIVSNLPVTEGEGIVTRSDRIDSNGEPQRVWSVEFLDQTILLEFVFDDTVEREMVWADLLARGGPLIMYLASQCVHQQTSLEEMMVAFKVAFTTTLNEFHDAQQLLEDYGVEYAPPGQTVDLGTVGEKGDNEDV